MKNGTRLKQVAKEFSNRFKNQALNQEQNPYYHLEYLVSSDYRSPSPGFSEYTTKKTFVPQLEFKKNNYLPNYLLEKYKLISKSLQEDKYFNNLEANQKLQKQLASIEEKPTQVEHFQKAPKDNLTTSSLLWEDGIQKLDQEIIQKVDQELKLEKQAVEYMLKKREQFKHMFGAKKKKQVFIDPRSVRKLNKYSSTKSLPFIRNKKPISKIASISTKKLP